MKRTYQTGPAALLLLAAPLPAVAQPAPSVQTVQSVPDENSSVERLGRYIRILASSPRDLDSLLGAGQAALDVGDANAALGFFARAEQVSPSNGRAKAGLGSSLVMIERPDDALRLFSEAVSMGVPEALVARDRGLAYDLRGDYRRAQRDYALAMTRGRDDELVRRYALSLGIAGDRAGAIAMLNPLLHKQDQAAWRARAFIYAMTGDVPGANGIARQLMVPAMASAMSPLLARVAALNAAERAHAVNFGTVPSDGTQLAVRTGDPYFPPVQRTSAPASRSGLVSAEGLVRPPVASGDTGLIPSGEPFGPRVRDTSPVVVARASAEPPSALPGAMTPVPTAAPAYNATTAAPGFTRAPIPERRLGDRIGQRIGPVDPSRLPPEARGASTRVQRVEMTALPAPRGLPPLERAPVAVAPTPAAPVATIVPSVQGPPVAVAETPAFETPAPAPASVTLARPAPTPAQAVAPIVVAQIAPSSVATAAPSTSPPRPEPRLAGLLDGIEREIETAATLPNAAELRTARAAARKKAAQVAAQDAADEAAKREAAEKVAAAKRNPARIWVQVATGRNDSGLALTLQRLRSDNEAALKNLGGWSAPYKATNRILVGPLKSTAAARELVGKLAKNGVSAMTWSSDAGDEVEKIATR